MQLLQNIKGSNPAVGAALELLVVSSFEVMPDVWHSKPETLLFASTQSPADEVPGLNRNG